MTKAGVDDARRLELCKNLLNPFCKDTPLDRLAAVLRRKTIDERHYWIGTFYTLLLPEKQRRKQAAYFTPPQLSRAVVGLLKDNGFAPLKHSVLDPAAGGAAFLSTIAAEMTKAGATPESILKRIRGIEIDAGLGRLSEALIGERLNRQIRARSIVSTADALTTRHPEKYDLVIANPPFGRLIEGEQDDTRWRDVCHAGHVNKYALFLKLCFQRAKPGGLVALVLPSSFIAGPLYNKLRTFIRTRGEVILLGSVTDREDVFVDVDQDISVLVAKIGKPHRASSPIAIGRFTPGKGYSAIAARPLPEIIGAPWNVPLAKSSFPVGGCTLADYGVTVKAGYFVWNREQERMEKRRKRKTDMPLVWARNVREGKLCVPAARKRNGIDFVQCDAKNPAVVRVPAIVMQRTTNSSQQRRLIAARVAPRVYDTWGGFVSENHTIVITTDRPTLLDRICKLLNSTAVDRRYRQLSGTASVSVTLLRELDLPSPSALEQALADGHAFDQAVDVAYRTSESAAAVA